MHKEAMMLSAKRNSKVLNCTLHTQLLSYFTENVTESIVYYSVLIMARADFKGHKEDLNHLKEIFINYFCHTQKR